MNQTISCLASLILVAGCSPKFGLVGPKQVDLLDPERCVVAVATTNELSSSWLAATELTNYVAKVTGVELKVVDAVAASQPVDAVAHRVTKKGDYDFERRGEPPRLRCTIVIGTLADLGEAAPEEARRALAATDNFEAAWTGVRDSTLWIVGKDETAELYATYRFIEKHLGVRWLTAWTPDDPGEYVPHLDALTIPEGYTEFREPRFHARRLDVTGQWGVQYPPVHAGACAVRNGMQISPAYGSPIPTEADKWFQPARRLYQPRCSPRVLTFAAGGHTTFTDVIPGKVWYKDHSEYFPLVDGKRIRNGMYCLSNPDVANLIADYIIAAYEKRGKNGCFIYGQVDRDSGQCECAECRKLDGTTDGHFNISGRFQTCVMRASKKVWEKYPDCDLRTWAYSTYRTFPKNVTFDPRITVEYCTHNRCYAHRIDDPACSRNAAVLADMKNFAAATTIWNTYEYFTSTPNMYCCHELDEAYDIRAYDALGIRGWKNEWQFSDGRRIPEPKPGSACFDKARSNWQWLYVTAKILWDPSLDAEAVLADAESKYYGPAYPAMKKYHDLRRKLWSEAPDCMGYPHDDQRTPQILNAPGAKEKLFALLDEADRLVEADASSRRPYQSGRAGSMNPPPTPNSNSIYRYRVAADRRYLERYWVKPNEEYREIQKKVLTALPATTPIVVDGKDDEAAWAKAVPFEGLCAMQALGLPPGPIPAARQTKMRVLYDAKGVYVFFNAKEPDGDPLPPKPTMDPWYGEGVEVFVKAPTADNLIYHFIVNPDGRVWGSNDRTGEDPKAFDIVAKSVWKKGEWTLEIMIPAKSTAPAEPGTTWKVNFGRNVAERKGKCVAGSYTMDGISYADSAKFRPLKIR